MIRGDSKDSAGWSRNYINKQVARLKSMFRWATENEMIPAGVYQSLKTVAGLKKGRSEARETEPVKPVPIPHVEAVLPFLSPQVRAMVQLQLVTGARGGEICSMRSMDIDTSDDVWVYRPAQHKSTHHGHERIIRIGPKGKEILNPFLKSDLSAFIFSPADAEAQRLKDRREKRRTPLHYGNGPGDNRKRDPKRVPGDRYEVEAYAHAVAHGCDRAFPLPDHLARRKQKTGKKRMRWETIADWKTRLDAEKWAEVQTWRKSHRFHPHQLRHSAGTLIRAVEGIEMARIILGHRHLKTTEIYAEQDVRKAVEVMRRIG
jgi:integrase